MDISGVKLNGCDIKDEALRICQEFLGSSWNKITVSELIFFQVSGGLSNTLYSCCLPESISVENSKIPRQVLLRVYGPMQDATHVVVQEATIFMLLSERQLGPKLYGIFPNGRLEQFIPSKSLSSDELRKYSKTIAREMAKTHAIDAPLRKVPDLVKKFTMKWLKEIEEDSSQKGSLPFHLTSFYADEVDWITEEMAKANSPITFCHNDLQGGNILLLKDSFNKEDPNLMLIDFEFATYNYRDFDIANHFCEWMFDYNTPDPPHFTVNYSKFPSREEKTVFIKTYLEQLVLEGVLNASDIDEEIKRMLKVNKTFGMASHIFWSLWSEKMAFTSSMAFCHRKYGEERRNIFRKLKELHLKEQSNVCNGNSYVNYK